MPPWTDPDWQAGAHAWIRALVERAGARVTGEIEQPHVRPWSTVLRVPTTAGDLWFKANGPPHAYEAAVVELLARRRPDCVPELWASDRERGWLLMADGGERLREIVERERDLGRWLDILPRYGQLELDAAEDTEELLSAGAPDRRLAGIAAQFAEVVEVAHGLTEEERDGLRARTAHVAELSDELAAFGIPETIQHDDFHDGQVFLRDGAYLFFDWGDSCISHPFFTLSVTLEGVLSWGLDDVENAVDIEPFRDAYLTAFSEYGTVAELREAVRIALRLGWICRALNVQRYASALPSPNRDEELAGVGLRLKLALL